MKIDTFHALGKFLYNKRSTANSSSPSITSSLHFNTRPIPPSYHFRFGKQSFDFPHPKWTDRDIANSKTSIYAQQRSFQLLRQPKWLYTDHSLRLPHSKMIPKILRPPIYFDVDKILDDLSSTLPFFVDLIYSNFLYFYGNISDAAEFLDQVSHLHIDARLY